MSSLFAFPWALWGLLSIPALLALYFLRRRAQKRLPVSSLFLWAAEKQVQQGGARWEKIQKSWLLAIELLLLLLLTLAAAEPLWTSKANQPPLMVVLDDSFSMRAGGSNSPRSRALTQLAGKIRNASPSYVRLVLAGSRPSVLGGMGGMGSAEKELAKALKQWECWSPHSDLQRAIGFAMQLGGSRARVLVVTDHPPLKQPKGGRIRYWSLGKPHDNVAIVQAVRTAQPNEDWVLVSIANHSREAGNVKLRLQVQTKKPSSQVFPLSMKSGEIRRLTLRVAKTQAPILLQLDDDALDIDNKALLLAQDKRPVRTQLLFQSANLKAVVQKALLATNSVTLTDKAVELQLTDRSLSKLPPTDAWRVRFVQEEKTLAYTGPWVMQRSHPLMKGLSFKGVIWSAGKAGQMPGTPLLMAGNVPLLSASALSDEQQTVYFRWREDLSNFARTPNWPIFLWNLTRWRSSRQPGFREPNTNVGVRVEFAVPQQVSQFAVKEPGGRTFNMIRTTGRVRLPARRPGLHEVVAGTRKWAFSVNALSREESDLRAHTPGEWGQWKQDEWTVKKSVSLRWPLLLLAFLFFLLHQYLIRQQRELEGGQS